MALTARTKFPTTNSGSPTYGLGLRLRSNEPGSSDTRSSRLPEAYIIATHSPSEIAWPPSSVS